MREYPSEKTNEGTAEEEEEESMVTGEDERERATMTESGGESAGKVSLISSIFLAKLINQSHALRVFIRNF